MDPDPYSEYGSNTDPDPQHWYRYSLQAPPPGWPDTAPVRGDDITHLAGFLGRFFEPLVDSKVDIAVALQEGVYAGNKCLGGREEKVNIFYNDINPRTGTGTH